MPLTLYTCARAAAIGATAGLRSMTPFALLVYSGAKASPLHSLPWRALSVCAAGGEMVADKLPSVPSRLQPGPLAGRLVVGAIAGAASARRGRLPAAVGGVVGTLGALAGAYVGYTVRSALDRHTRVPDLVWALAEDAAAVSLGLWALRARPGGA